MPHSASYDPDEGIESSSRYANFANAWTFASLKETALYFDKARVLSDYLVADRSVPGGAA